MTAQRRLLPGLLPALLLSTAGCMTAAEHQQSADDEVYGVLANLRQQFVADPGVFTIDHPDPFSYMEGVEGDADLAECLHVAARVSTDYQVRKEGLYLAALDLTFERYLFDVQTQGALGASVSRGAFGSETGQADGGLALTRLLGTGALIVADIGLRLVRDLSSGDGFDAVTDLGLTITQPLLRGSGERIVKENLTQSERNVVYEVRSYERFRRTFSVQVAQRVYRILQQADVVANQELNSENLRVLRERNEQLAEAGRLSDIQVDQARQDELRSHNRLIVEQQRYEAQLDDLRQFLGVPVERPFQPDPTQLEDLATLESLGFPLDEEFLAEFALRERLDYMTALDRVDDARRRVDVAADALRAGLELQLDANLSSAEGRPLDFDLDDTTGSLALDLDLPIDRLAERNAYRAALISLQAAERDALDLADDIRGQLRAALREAIATAETNVIQRGAVVLAERRAESTALRMAAGRADTRDILEAQEDLLEAKNAATQSRIDHHLALLALWRDIELLRVDDTGLSFEESLLEPGDLQP